MHGEMKRLHCKTCGVEFGILQELFDSFVEHGGYYHCSNGHPWGWNKDQAARRQREREQEKIKQDNARLQDELAAKTREMEAATAEAARKIARMKKRASAGSCPCCKRTFSNMATHMRKQHPEFGKPVLVAEKIA